MPNDKWVPKKVANDVFGRTEIAAVLRSAAGKKCWVVPGTHVVNLHAATEETKIKTLRGTDAADFIFSLTNEEDILKSVAALFRLMAKMHAEKAYHLEFKLNNCVFSSHGIEGHNVGVTLSNNETYYAYAIDYETMFMKEYTDEEQDNFDAVCDALSDYGYRDFSNYIANPLHAERCDVFALLVTIVLFMKINKRVNSTGRKVDPLYKRLYCDVLTMEINPLQLPEHNPVELEDTAVVDKTQKKRTYTYFYVTGAPIKSATCVAQLVEALLPLRPTCARQPPST